MNENLPFRAGGRPERRRWGGVDFAAVAGHDLKAPARNIAMLTDMLTEALADGDAAEANAFAERLRRCATQLQTLVTGLQAFAEASSAEPARRVVEVGAVVDDALAMLSADLKRCGAEIDIRGEVGVFADRSLLTLVMVKLIENVLLHGGAARPKIEIRAWSTTGTTRISVSDNGGGVRAGAEDHFFEPFRRAPVPRGRVAGVGLGLSVCREIVENHGGEIWFALDAEVGARVEIALPAQGERSQSVGAESGRRGDQQPAVVDGLVLVVDDDESDLETLARAIRSAEPGLEIVATTDPAEASALAAAHRPQLVCVDFSMPSRDGDELIAELRRGVIGDGRPIVVISSSIDAGVVRRCYASRANAYYRKPESLEGYRDLARRVTDHWLRRVEATAS